MLDDTQKALDAFNKPTDDEKAGLGTFDIWCGGDFEMWKKVANTMRLRIALRLSKRADEMKAAGYDVDYMNAENFTKYLTDSAAEFKTIVEEAGLMDEIGG